MVRPEITRVSHDLVKSSATEARMSLHLDNDNCCLLEKDEVRAPEVIGKLIFENS